MFLCVQEGKEGATFRLDITPIDSFNRKECNIEQATWRLEEIVDNAPDHGDAEHAFCIVSNFTEHKITYDGTKMDLTRESGQNERWKFHATSGELCFLTAPFVKEQQLSCSHPGNLTMTSGSWTSKEVWRLIDTGDSKGSVYISSWAHDGNYLACSSDGTISTSQHHSNAENVQNESF